MSKEKLQNLTRYAENIKGRLSSAVPEKHKNNPHTYKQFLERELAATTAKIDAIKMNEPAGGKK